MNSSFLGFWLKLGIILLLIIGLVMGVSAKGDRFNGDCSNSGEILFMSMEEQG